MAKSNSRLQETSFSGFNLRDSYIQQQPEYHSFLRDDALFSNYGIKVLIRVPSYSEDVFDLNDNNVDEYSNFVDTIWVDTTESVIPLFKEYRQNVNENGMAADGTDAVFPLEVIIPTKLYLPKNSRIIFTEYNSREEQISREWEVLGTQMKQLSGSKTYSRIANCVPARQGSFTTEELSKGTIWFDYVMKELELYNMLKAQGVLWFYAKRIDKNNIKVTRKDTIPETVELYPEYAENTSIYMYYDTRPVNIVSGGVGFLVGDTFELSDQTGKPIEIITDQEGDKQRLVLTVTETDPAIGSIKAFTLNITEGYTIFSETGTLPIQIYKNEDFPATINLACAPYKGNLYHETTEAPIISNPKTLTPYMINVVISGKKVPASVLN